MKKYFFILLIQILFILVTETILEKVFSFSRGEAFLIPAGCFMVMFLGVQMIQSKIRPQDTISDTGITGARLAGILVTGWLFPMCIGYVYVYPVAIILFIISIICLWIGRRRIKSFFTVRKLDYLYYFVYAGFVFLISSVVIVFFNVEEKVTEPFPLVYRGVIFIVLVLWNMISIPSNSLLAKFATHNYQNLYGDDNGK